MIRLSARPSRAPVFTFGTSREGVINQHWRYKEWKALRWRCLRISRFVILRASLRPRVIYSTMDLRQKQFFFSYYLLRRYYWYQLRLADVKTVFFLFQNRKLRINQHYLQYSLLFTVIYKCRLNSTKKLIYSKVLMGGSWGRFFMFCSS